mgnify:CR=1 FL=1
MPISTTTAEHYTWGDRCDGWHLVRTTGLSIIEERMPPGTTETRHHHVHAHQFFYVLEGELTLEVEHKRTMRNMSLFWCKALVEGNIAAEAEMLCAEVAAE